MSPARERSLLVLAVALAVLALGCEDEPTCFGDDCVNAPQAGSGGQTSSASGAGGSLFTNSASSTGGESSCTITNDGNEICDGLDNDCSGEIDEDFDFNGILTCGTCDNNCFVQLLNTDPATITCDWSGTAGEAGTCSFTDCATDFHDFDPNVPGCETYCQPIATNDVTCNNKDDDCNNVVDDGVDLCSDANNCGGCGIKCIVPHGTGQCVPSGMPPCNPSNTDCVIQSCDDDDNDGFPDWWDVDPNIPGCEYNCSLTNGGFEICADGVDNDCDGAIDGADTDLSGDPQLGLTCYGDPDGICANQCPGDPTSCMPSHAGVTTCVGQQVQCVGPNVLTSSTAPAETCNGNDDDCDGFIDDNPTDAGGSCGVSNVFPCQLGTQQCQNGGLVCVGNVDPNPEICNAVDDDCDGTIDDNPTDAGGACNVPPPPPSGATSPCSAGTLGCQGGALVCQGWTGPTSSTDACGDDSNCDGQLTNQPDLTNDVNNCGMCGNTCGASNDHAQWACVSSACQYQGCDPGWYDLNSDQICEYPCVFTGTEVCDNLDNNCDGQVDNVTSTPSPSQVCGVSPAATRPECTSQVTVQCQGGTWVCGFPPGVCSPTCQGTNEVCDALDNDCDGGFNENVPNYGQPCASDDGLPPPGHGACQTFGTYQCNGPVSTLCSAQKASCSTLPGGCTELCDDVDNDCDGLIDETYLDKGSDPAYFVKPAVTRVANGLWIFSHEASRPNATATSPGTGNGYHCSSCPPGIPAAPSGSVLDETIACSVGSGSQGVLPWFNVNPIEAEQTCDAIGGYLCDTADWQLACEATQACDWGYNPRGAACNTAATSSKYCNLAPFDFDPASAGNQDGLLPTGSSLLANCWADWSGLFSNTQPSIFDITGNLREITRDGVNVYPLLGGAYNAVEPGATCQFDFYVVNETFKLLDTGFRCCFSSDPRL